MHMGINTQGATSQLKRMAVCFLRRVYSFDYIDYLIRKYVWRNSLMLTIGDLIAVISLCLTSFGLGYTIGANSNKTEKK